MSEQNQSLPQEHPQAQEAQVPIQEAQVPIQEAQVPIQESSAPTESKSGEKPKLKKFYKLVTCSKCKGRAIYLPVQGSTACETCNGVTGDGTSEDPKSYLPESYLKHSEVKDKEISRYAVFCSKPSSVPGFDDPGRNSACVCGSGKKFKKCCMREIEQERNDAADSMRVKYRNDEICQHATSMRILQVIFHHQKTHGWKEIPQEEIKLPGFYYDEKSKAIKSVPDIVKAVEDEDKERKEEAKRRKAEALKTAVVEPYVEAPDPDPLAGAQET